MGLCYCFIPRSCSPSYVPGQFHLNSLLMRTTMILNLIISFSLPSPVQTKLIPFFSGYYQILFVLFQLLQYISLLQILFFFYQIVNSLRVVVAESKNSGDTVWGHVSATHQLSDVMSAVTTTRLHGKQPQIFSGAKNHHFFALSLWVDWWFC